MLWECVAQKLADAGKLSLLQEMYKEWPFMQVDQPPPQSTAVSCTATSYPLLQRSPSMP